MKKHQATPTETFPRSSDLVSALLTAIGLVVVIIATSRKDISSESSIKLSLSIALALFIKVALSLRAHPIVARPLSQAGEELKESIEKSDLAKFCDIIYDDKGNVVPDISDNTAAILYQLTLINPEHITPNQQLMIALINIAILEKHESFAYIKIEGLDHLPEKTKRIINRLLYNTQLLPSLGYYSKIGEIKTDLENTFKQKVLPMLTALRLDETVIRACKRQVITYLSVARADTDPTPSHTTTFWMRDSLPALVYLNSLDHPIRCTIIGPGYQYGTKQEIFSPEAMSVQAVLPNDSKLWIMDVDREILERLQVFPKTQPDLPQSEKLSAEEKIVANMVRETASSGNPKKHIEVNLTYCPKTRPIINGRQDCIIALNSITYQTGQCTIEGEFKQIRINILTYLMALNPGGVLFLGIGDAHTLAGANKDKEEALITPSTLQAYLEELTFPYKSEFTIASVELLESPGEFVPELGCKALKYVHNTRVPQRPIFKITIA